VDDDAADTTAQEGRGDATAMKGRVVLITGATAGIGTTHAPPMSHAPVRCGVVGGDEADLVVPGASSPSSPTVGRWIGGTNRTATPAFTQYTPKPYLRPSLSEEADDG
jgi:hypothetical protein